MSTTKIKELGCDNVVELDEAISNAIDGAKAITKTSGMKNLRVEEVDLSDDDEYIITLGWDEKFEDINVSYISTTKRIYKVFVVDAETGKILKMKVWKQNNAL